MQEYGESYSRRKVLECLKDRGFDTSWLYEESVGKSHVVYTPQGIVRRMLAITFKNYFKSGNRKEKLENLKLIDISCGSGNFLVEALFFLIKLSKVYFGEYKFYSNWITGIDVDGEALGLANERLDKLLGHFGFQEGVSLIHSDGLKLEIEDKYDIVIGNPPYIGEKGNKELFDDIRATEFGRKYYEGRMDYFYFFVEKGIDILKENGILTYITTNYWLKADSATILRDKVKTETDFLYIINNEGSVFKRASGQHNIIYSLKKSKNNIESIIENENQIYKVKNDLLFDNRDKIILAEEEKILFYNNFFEKKTYLLRDILNINQGIVSGCDKAFVFDEYKEEYADYLKPFYKNSDIVEYNVRENKFWILYIPREINPPENILDHLSNYKEKLSNRREAKKSVIEWYQLQWGRTAGIFEQEKIVGRQRGTKSLFAYSNGDMHGSADIYYLSKKQNLFDVDLFYILGYLNSSVFYDYFWYYGKRKGEMLELYSTPLLETPIYYPSDTDKINYVRELVKGQIKSYSVERQEKIDKFFKDIMKS